MFDEKISQTLERICLKAMSQEPVNRYSTAKDLAEELRLAIQPKRRLWVGMLILLLLAGVWGIATVRNSNDAGKADTTVRKTQTSPAPKDADKSKTKSDTKEEKKGILEGMVFFDAALNRITVMDRSATKVFYSFDGLEWKEALDVRRAPAGNLYGKVDELGQFRETGGTLLVKYRDSQGRESDVSVFDFKAAIPGHMFDGKLKF